VPPTTVGVAVTASPVGKNQAWRRRRADCSVSVVRPAKVCWASWPKLGQSQGPGTRDDAEADALEDDDDEEELALHPASATSRAAVDAARHAWRRAVRAGGVVAIGVVLVRRNRDYPNPGEAVAPWGGPVAGAGFSEGPDSGGTIAPGG